MSLHWRLVATFAMVALLPGCRLAPMRVAFAYDSSSERGMMAPECAGIHQLSVRDGREVSSLVVGRRSIEYAGRVLDQAPVEMSGSVLGWLTAGAQEILERHRYPLRAPNNPSLMVTLESLGVNEKFDGRSTYLSSVRLRAEVTLPDGGRCTSVPIAVESSDTGIPNFERNYQERMNHALDRALIGLLASPDVRNALCGRCEGGAAVTQAGTGALTIKVVDAIDRRPVRQVNVVVAGRTGVTDQSGTFHLKNLASGPAAVVAIRAGFRTSEEAVVVISGQDTTLLVTLSPEGVTPKGSVVGTVRNARTGRPVRATVELVGLPTANTKTNGSGEFALQVPEGTHQLRVVAPGLVEQRKELSIQANGKVILNIDLAPVD